MAKSMASTRDKRLKTDSPTPAQPIEIASITPTTKTSTAIKLKRMSRNRSGILSVKTENEDGNDSVGLSEDTQSSTTSADNLPKTPNTRTKRQMVKDDKEEEPIVDEKELDDSVEASKDPDTPRTRKLTKAQIMKKKGAALAMSRRTALITRKSLPLPVKSSLRNISRRLSGGVKVAEKDDNQAAAKKAKPVRKIAAEKKEVEPKEEEPESVPEVEDAEVAEEPEVLEKPDESIETEPVLDVSIKQEKISATVAAIDLNNVRRSTRQRKSTIKDRDSPFAGRRSQVREKSESKRDSISPALSTVSIKGEKESSKAISITVEQTETAEKDPSLSPELVSEEMDTESVQHLYDKPDFLENNLGIEQDPKLGEIVKVQEKTKVVEPIIKSDDELVKVDDVEMITVEVTKAPATESKEEKVNGVKKEEHIKDDVKVEKDKKAEKREDASVKGEESGEENKENNNESSAKSVGSGSPRSEDRLKIVSEENVLKLDPAETELLKQKESHLLTLGLLTHKAADEAKLAKLKRQEELAKSNAQQPAPSSRKSKKDSSNDQQYTGTLKTIIKLNRTDKEKRKTRMPLKMTFQKKNRDRDSNGSSNSSDSFYTIQDVSFLRQLENLIKRFNFSI